MQEIRTVGESEAWLAGFAPPRRLEDPAPLGDLLPVGSVEDLGDGTFRHTFVSTAGDTIGIYARHPPKPPTPLPDGVHEIKPPEPDLSGKEVQTPEQLVDESIRTRGPKFRRVTVTKDRRVSDMPKRIHRAALGRKVAELVKDVGRTFARQNRDFARLAKKQKKAAKPAARRGRR